MLRRGVCSLSAWRRLLQPSQQLCCADVGVCAAEQRREEGDAPGALHRSAGWGAAWSSVAPVETLQLVMRSLIHTSAHAAHAKARGRGGKGSRRQAADEEDGAQAPEDQEEEEEELSLEPFEEAMAQAVRHFQEEVGKIHGGRASPGLLEPVEVLAHNERLPLKNYGAVTARTPSLLVVSLFNPSDGEAVARSIRESPLKLQARVEGKEVHVPVPRPTLDQVKGLVKLVAQEAEKSKGSVRSARHRALDAVRAAIKAKDERLRTEKQVQALTDRHIQEVERLKQAKDRELEAMR